MLTQGTDERFASLHMVDRDIGSCRAAVLALVRSDQPRLRAAAFLARIAPTYHV